MFDLYALITSLKYKILYTNIFSIYFKHTFHRKKYGISKTTLIHGEVSYIQEIRDAFPIPGYVTLLHSLVFEYGGLFSFMSLTMKVPAS